MVIKVVPLKIVKKNSEQDLGGKCTMTTIIMKKAKNEKQNNIRDQTLSLLACFDGVIK